MPWPHEPAFRGRGVIFWGLSALAFAGLSSVPGSTWGEIAAGMLATAVVAWAIHRYVDVIGRLDARFRHVHPQKFRLTSVGTFYSLGLLACGLLVAGPWLVAHDRTETPAELMVYYLAVPCLLSGAAAAYRTYDRSRR